MPISRFEDRCKGRRPGAAAAGGPVARAPYPALMRALTSSHRHMSAG